VKVQNYSLETQKSNKNNNSAEHARHSSPSFRAGGIDSAMAAFGGTMQWIQDKGFLASFLIQDGLGMTAPRVGAAFLRDKEVTGEYNVQEGMEVLGREGLTGPCMMAVAPIMMYAAAKFGRSTSVNSQLINKLGNNLIELIKKPEFNKELLKDKSKFEEVFFKSNINQILDNSIGKGKYNDDAVNYIMEQIKNYKNVPKEIKKKGKYKDECLDNITNYINDLKYKTSDDLNSLQKIKLGSENSNGIKEFSTKDVIDAMIKYSDDAINLNKNLEKLDAAKAEDLKNSSVAKRFITNISTMAATLGVLAILPKIYARSSISPGAKTAMQLKEAKEKSQEENNIDKANNQKSEISFKGKGNNKTWLERFGKYINQKTKEAIPTELEYNGHNFTNSLMAGLSLFGLLTPRGLRAYERAQVDENGKKDLTELYEILIRDVSSSLAVVFAVPMLTRACVTSYENKSGFVLMQKDRNMSNSKTILDLFNPYSKAHVMSNSEIAALYNNVDSQEKMVNFCKYINKNNGDLQKILAKSEELSNVIKDNSLDLKSLEGLSKNEKNKKILEYFENLGKDGKIDKKTVDEMIIKIMKGTKNSKANKILSFARGLNSIPAVITTFIISPYLLGWFIPRLTYANTRRLHEKAEKERENKINTAA